MKTSKHLFLNSFALKIIAFVLMFIDHMAVIALQSGLFQPQTTFYQVCVVFRYIGRLAFPLFMFFLAEGLRYTKDRDRYIMRLAILWLSMTLIQIGLVQAGLYGTSMSPNAFMDIMMCALVIYLFEKKQVWLRILAILPLSYILLSYACDLSEQYCLIHNMTSNWSSFFPYFLRCDYSLYGFLMFLGFYYARPLAQKVTAMYLQVSAPLPPIKIEEGQIKEEEQPEEELFDVTKTNEYHTLLNTINITVIVLINVIFYVIYKIDNGAYDPYFMYMQSWAILSGIFLIFYNGKLGYHAKWWKWFEYLFYPLHLGLLFLIFMLIAL